MRTFIFSYDRPDTITTHHHYWDDHTTVVVHSQDMADEYVRQTPQFARQIVATRNPKGLAHNRNWALDQMHTGEWALFLVDDMKSLTRTDWLYRDTIKKLPITIENQKRYIPKMKRPMSTDEMRSYCEILTRKVDRLNCHLIGFSNYDNAIYRANRYSYNCLADGRAWLVRKTDLTFDLEAQLIDDMSWCAKNRYAGYDIVTANWILPDCRRYSAGAYGSITDRLDQKLDECQYLVDTYPRYVRYADKAGWPTGSHVQMRASRPRDRRLLTI